MNTQNNERVYYYHSKPEIDPKRKGRRMTVCCIAVDNKLLFGIAVQSQVDTFTKEFGRRVSYARAKKMQLEPRTIPEKGVKSYILEVSKDLVRQHLRPLTPLDWGKFEEASLKSAENQIKIAEILGDEKAKTLAERVVKVWKNWIGKKEEVTASNLHPV